MKSCIVFAACVYLLQVSRCLAAHGSHDSFDSGNYNVSWTYNSMYDKISVQVEVKTLGWVGFGFAMKAPNSMQNYDVIVGGVKNGSGYINDFYTGGRSRPPKDAKQNYNLTSAKEEDGKTKLMFERKRDTDDDKDVELKAGEGVFLIWAYSSSEGDNSTTFPQHSSSRRGWSSDKHMIVPGNESTMAPTTPTTKPSKANFTGHGALVNVVLAVMLSFLYIHL